MRIGVEGKGIKVAGERSRGEGYRQTCKQVKIKVKVKVEVKVRSSQIRKTCMVCSVRLHTNAAAHHVHHDIARSFTSSCVVIGYSVV